MTGATRRHARAPRAGTRSRAALRLRRVTQLSIALMVAVGGAFTALAAGSTHTKKTIVRSSRLDASRLRLSSSRLPHRRS